MPFFAYVFVGKFRLFSPKNEKSKGQKDEFRGPDPAFSRFGLDFPLNSIKNRRFFPSHQKNGGLF
jgi:hypothetical protein